MKVKIQPLKSRRDAVDACDSADATGIGASPEQRTMTAVSAFENGKCINVVGLVCATHTREFVFRCRQASYWLEAPPQFTRSPFATTHLTYVSVDHFSRDNTHYDHMLNTQTGVIRLKCVFNIDNVIHYTQGNITEFNVYYPQYITLRAVWIPRVYFHTQSLSCEPVGSFWNVTKFRVN